MKKSIVLQLQEMASNRTHSECELLRCGLMVATKLNLSEFRKWILSEMNGYGSGKDVPEYRVLYGEVNVRNPFHGLQPFFISGDQGEIRELFKKICVTESVESLQHMLSNLKEGSAITYPYPAEVEAFLRNIQECFSPLPPVRVVSPSQIAGILGKVRTKLLDWALTLESEGILGEGMSFSEDEKSKAASSQSIHIENFQGVFGNVSGGTINQTMHMSVRPGNFASLHDHLKDKGVEEKDLKELETAVMKDPDPTKKGQLGGGVSAWIGKMVGKAADGTWGVGVGAAGNLLASAVWKFYGFS